MCACMVARCLPAAPTPPRPLRGLQHSVHAHAHRLHTAPRKGVPRLTLRRPLCVRACAAGACVSGLRCEGVELLPFLVDAARATAARAGGSAARCSFVCADMLSYDAPAAWLIAATVPGAGRLAGVPARQPDLLGLAGAPASWLRYATPTPRLRHPYATPMPRLRHALGRRRCARPGP